MGASCFCLGSPLDLVERCIRPSCCATNGLGRVRPCSRSDVFESDVPSTRRRFATTQSYARRPCPISTKTSLVGCGSVTAKIIGWNVNYCVDCSDSFRRKAHRRCHHWSWRRYCFSRRLEMAIRMGCAWSRNESSPWFHGFDDWGPARRGVDQNCRQPFGSCGTGFPFRGTVCHLCPPYHRPAYRAKEERKRSPGCGCCCERTR